MRAVALVAGLVAALVGCAAPAPAVPPPPRPACARPADDVQVIDLDPAIHLQVTVLHAGSGPRAAALLPQSNGDICQLADLGHRLAGQGYQVATFGPWSSPYARPVEAAYRVLAAAGATRIAVLGASQGAAMALVTAPALDPAPVGVVALSAESSAERDGDALAGAAAYRGPVLLAGTEDDVYAPGGVTRRIAEVHPGTEQVLLFPGGAHGIELLPRVEGQVDTFLKRVLDA